RDARGAGADGDHPRRGDRRGARDRAVVHGRRRAAARGRAVMRAIVVRLDNDGDVLLAGPAMRGGAAGADHVTLLCGPRGAAAAALLPGVDELLVRRAEWIDPE